MSRKHPIISITGSSGAGTTSVKRTFEQIFHREKVNAVLDTLSDREREILVQRFGLLDGRERTLEEVGRHFKVTRERVRQIEAKALRKLKHPSRSDKLRTYLDNL